MTRLLDLNVVELRPRPSDHAKTQNEQLWAQNPDKCCEINKVEPLEQIKGQYSVWMSGLIGFQDSDRDQLQIMDEQEDIIKFYPLIDWNSSLVEEYMTGHGLPEHPLKEEGYDSVGCTHCTVPGRGRNGRWSDSGKTECGLHR